MSDGLRRARAGIFDRRNSDETDRAVLSRTLLIDTIRQLEPFKASLTVIGAHAVFARVEHAVPGAVMPSTNDADLAVNPRFIAPEPTIIALMAAAGLEPAQPDRPGIYGYRDEADVPQRDRTTIDLIVPAAYAGVGRRAARIAGQKNAATKAEGIEFALYDRSLLSIRPLAGTRQEAVDVMVAGAAALLIAKAHKVRDRVAQYDDKPSRLRPKDSSDIGMLMLASDPVEVLHTIQRISTEHREIAHIGRAASQILVMEYLHDESGLVRNSLIEGVAQFAGVDATVKLDAWLRGFEAASREWRRTGAGRD